MKNRAGHLSCSRGFTLVELVVVVSVIGILFTLAIPTYLNYRKKAKSTEAPVLLGNIRELEHAYFVEHDTFTTDLNALNFKAEGKIKYTYEVVGADTTGFTARATANLDRDADLDIWTINNHGHVTHTVRD